MGERRERVENARIGVVIVCCAGAQEARERERDGGKTGCVVILVQSLVKL